MEKEKKCYIVSFDPRSEESRTKIRQKLKEFDSYCPINRYCWAILTEKSAKEVRDFVKQAMQPSERLFVVLSGTEAAWRNTFGEKHSAWLKENL